MALLILNERNELFRMAENLEDASFIISNLHYYQSLNKVINISDQDFIDIKYDIKAFKSYDGSTVTYHNGNPDKLKTITKETLDSLIKFHIFMYDRFIDQKGSIEHPFNTKIKSAKEALSNIDTSSLNFPIQLSHGEYIKSLNINYVSPIQF